MTIRIAVSIVTTLSGVNRSGEYGVGVFIERVQGQDGSRIDCMV